MDPDFYREEFLKYLAKGMTHMEARMMFDDQELSAAVNVELERGDCRQVLNLETMRVESACGHETLFDLCVKASFEDRNRKDFEEQAVPLMMAGWTMETPNPTNSKEF